MLYLQISPTNVIILGHRRLLFRFCNDTVHFVKRYFLLEFPEFYFTLIPPRS